MKNSNLPGICRFCDISQGRTLYGLVDKPIASTEDHFSVASIGALVEGWSLIVPVEHCLSLAEAYKRASFRSFMQQYVKRVQSEFGRVVVFEHGANKVGSPTSCGTDHAHLHIVPLATYLGDLVDKEMIGEWTYLESTHINEVACGAEYLFYSDDPLSDGLKGHIHVLKAPISQFFRKLIAKHLDKSSISDYKTNFLLPVAESTHTRLVKIPQ